MMTWHTTGAHGYAVRYDSWMEGGGTWFGQEYLDILTTRYAQRVFQRCLEWCSGPGFIGFNILDHGICDSLCLVDKYEPAITKAVKQTVLENDLISKVSAYPIDQIRLLPDHEQFDLVVANPPHYLECPGNENDQRIMVDPHWYAHQEFFQSIRQHLLPGGIILLQENQAGSLSGAKEFEPFILKHGLKITDVFLSTRHFDINGPTQIYYIEIQVA
jgi:methylase of polypeptide subunit release factors